jgi:DNA recombination protein Rad52
MSYLYLIERPSTDSVLVAPQSIGLASCVPQNDTMTPEKINEGFLADVVNSYKPPGNPTHYNQPNQHRLAAKEVEWVRNHDGSILLDHNGVPLSVDRMLATKPLRHELSSRPGPGNKKLTYLSGEGVTRTLNEVFGFDGWNLEIKKTTQEQCIRDEKSSRFHVAYTATVRLTHRKSGAFKEDCGAADAADRAMGTAIANALKASITDALKRAARHFGDKLGNSLYQGTFSINKAPVTLEQALEQYATDRANSKFGIQTNQTNHGMVAGGKPPSPQRPKVESIQQGVPSQNVPPKQSSMPPPPIQRHHQPIKMTIMPSPRTVGPTKVPAAVHTPLSTIHQMGIPTHDQTPTRGLSVIPMVTPGIMQPPPTPGQRLQGSTLFGLNKHPAIATPGIPSANSENQPPCHEDNRPGTSAGLKQNQQAQDSSLKIFPGKKRMVDSFPSTDAPAKKPAIAVQRVSNPYA